MKIGVFIGRFQPFHIGHLDALRRIFQQCDHVKIVLGSANESRTENNPWTAQEREQIIRDSLDESQLEKIEFLPLEDIIGDDDAWLKLLLETVGEYDMMYSGNDWNWEIFDAHGISYQKITYNIDISATKIRDMLRNDESVDEFIIPQNLQLPE